MIKNSMRREAETPIWKALEFDALIIGVITDCGREIDAETGRTQSCGRGVWTDIFNAVIRSVGVGRVAARRSAAAFRGIAQQVLDLRIQTAQIIARPALQIVKQIRR